MLSRSHTWLLQAENLLLIGPSGVGKTHLAIAVTMAIIEQDQPCRFFPATALVQLLQKAKASYELPALIQKLDHYSLLVIDDISYVRRSELETSVLFEVICHRYERKSLLLTSNQPFREWDEIFPSGSMTVAAVDRLVHHCHIVGIKGESYRQKTAAARVVFRRSKPAYVIDAGVFAVTIWGCNHSTGQKHCGDTRTGPQALGLTPNFQLD